MCNIDIARSRDFTLVENNAENRVTFFANITLLNFRSTFIIIYIFIISFV
jgi:hypothetical protein